MIDFVATSIRALSGRAHGERTEDWVSMGVLYVVATPIGNLEDVSARALRILRDASLIASEDTRHTGRLLSHFGIETPQISYHAFNERARVDRLLAALGDGDVALVTDAGTPGISDPGVALVDAALDAGISVQAVPGPSSLTAAASISGLLDGPFIFLGFLPRKGQERAALVGRAAGSGFGLVLFESPNRAGATLADLAVVMPGRRFALIRELTKLHEEILRGTLGDHLDERLATVRGEVVIVVGGSAGLPNQHEHLDLERTVHGLLAAGLKPSEAAREAAALTGHGRDEAYEIAVRLNRELRR